MVEPEPDPFEKWVSGMYDSPSIDLKTVFDRCAPLIVNLAPLRPNDAVLDVATGKGTILKKVAEIIGPKGKMVGVDTDSSLIEKAVLEFQEIPNVQFCHMDAHQLEFKENSFNVVFCGFGIDLFEDPAKAFKEFYRVLKRGGRAYISAWYLIMNFLPDNDDIIKQLTTAGFKDIEIVSYEFEYIFPKFLDWYNSPTSRKHEWELETLTPRDLIEIKKYLKEMYGPYIKADGLHQIYRAQIYCAVKEKKERKGLKGPKGPKGHRKV